MKKLAAAALTLTMALSMSTPAYAAGNVSNQDHDIKVSYEEGITTTETVYSVDVNWGSLEYTYQSNATEKWNPNTLKYEISKGTPSWTYDAGANEIKVTNHSNAAISANFAYEPTNTTVTGTFDQTKINLKSADGTEVAGAPTGIAKLTLGGDMAENADGVLGNVKVTIGDFQGDKADSSTIYSPSLSFYTTEDNNVFVATGTVTYIDDFTLSSNISLYNLKINGYYCVLDPNNSVTLEDNTLTEFAFKEAAQNTKFNNRFHPAIANKEYNYTLTINIKTKTGTIIVSPVE